MAQCITNQWVNTAPQVRLTVTIQSETNTTVTLKWVLDYVAHGYPASTGRVRAYWVDIDGVRVADNNFNINGISGTVTIASGTKVQNKANWDGYVAFACAFYFDLTWSGVYAGSLGASGTISIPAKPSYLVSYNANGGSGAPGAQTKWYGEALKLSSTKPTRTGYTFQGWGTTSGDTTVDYDAGANYTSNSSVTLYAIWKANTYTVIYDANGGTGAPASQTKTYGINLTLTTAKPTKTNYNFKGWGTSAASTTVAYAPGATYSNNSAITLYAIWELAYTPPRITDVELDRVNEYGTVADDGVSLSVKFKWATDKTVESVKAEYRMSGGTEFKPLMTFSASGTSGTVDYAISQITFDSEVGYDILLMVTDEVGSSTYLGSIAPMLYTIDFLKGGKGIAIGKPAANEGFEVNFDAKFEKTASFEDDVRLNSNIVHDGTGKKIITINENGSPMFPEHTGLANGIWLQGQLGSGAFANILRINESNQVELNWTSGGLQGRVTKEIWSGTLSQGGTINISELPYYRFFLAQYTGNMTESAFLWKTNPNSPSGNIYGFSIVLVNAGHIYINAISATYSGTSFTFISHTAPYDFTISTPSSAKLYKLIGVI